MMRKYSNLLGMKKVLHKMKKNKEHMVTIFFLKYMNEGLDIQTSTMTVGIRGTIVFASAGALETGGAEEGGEEEELAHHFLFWTRMRIRTRTELSRRAKASARKSAGSPDR